MTIAIVMAVKGGIIPAMDHIPNLTTAQLAIANAKPGKRRFLEGYAGTGKTTASIAYVNGLLEQGVPAHAILILVPQRTLGQPYVDRLAEAASNAGGTLNVATLGGIARRMVDLFWPVIVEDAGFAKPDERPVFLTLETAQYFMARIVRPLVEERGYFESVTIERNRLYSQIVDNLNKSAVVGFPPHEIAQRLKSAWVGDQAKSNVYDHAQECALLFRRYCLDNNLLDFSLQIELFTKYLWREPLCQDYLTGTYKHLIFDNIEEDTPVAHDIILDWLPHTRSALLVSDFEAGYRRFLGADVKSASFLHTAVDEVVRFDHSFVQSPDMASFSSVFRKVLQRRLTHDPLTDQDEMPENEAAHGDAALALRYTNHRYYPQMLTWVADQIASLVQVEGVLPGEIVVLAPFLSDSLRFSLSHYLQERGIQARSHRPSRALRDEPTSQVLLTLAALAHPAWGHAPSRYDVTYAFKQVIAGMDLSRAHLLTGVIYRPKGKQFQLGTFDQMNVDMQQRVTYAFGELVDRLCGWLIDYQSRPIEPLDHFLSLLYGEVLSQPGFSFHQDYEASNIAAMLIESVRKFRQIASPVGLDDNSALGLEYITMVQDGVIAAQYLQPWQMQDDESVLLAPAYTFLLQNRPVAVQFWLDVGSSGWWERLYQPLTHPYVLTRQWDVNEVWTDKFEFEARQEAMSRLAMGLVRRCRDRIYLGLSDLSEQGYEQDGPLLKAYQRVLRTIKPGGVQV